MRSRPGEAARATATSQASTRRLLARLAMGCGEPLGVRGERARRGCAMACRSGLPGRIRTTRVRTR